MKKKSKKQNYMLFENQLPNLEKKFVKFSKA